MKKSKNIKKASGLSADKRTFLKLPAYLETKPIEYWTEKEKRAWDKARSEVLAEIDREDEEEELRNQQEIIRKRLQEELRKKIELERLREINPNAPDERNDPTITVPLTSRIPRQRDINFRGRRRTQYQMPQSIESATDAVDFLYQAKKQLFDIIKELEELKRNNIDIGSQLTEKIQNLITRFESIKRILSALLIRRAIKTINLKRYAQTGRDIKVFRRPPGRTDWLPPGITRPSTQPETQITQLSEDEIKINEITKNIENLIRLENELYRFVTRLNQSTDDEIIRKLRSIVIGSEMQINKLRNLIEEDILLSRKP